VFVDRQLVLTVFGVLVGLGFVALGVIQAVPYRVSNLPLGRRLIGSVGRDFSQGDLGFGSASVASRRSNPPVVAGPNWDDPATEALARRACFDCHSNEVRVPWYGHVAPMAWMVRDHVDDGRAALNLSEMHRPQEEAHESGEEVAEGEMPPWWYLALHPEARLDPAERRALAAGLDATLGGERRGSSRGHEDED
jgi:hypothetical protein